MRGGTTPETRYARTGDVSIAYQVVGDGPIDIVFVPGFISHLDLQWENPLYAAFFERLASFSRLILFDKRGTGLSDRDAGAATSLDVRMDDVRAVMDAAGSKRAALFGASEGGPMSIVFAATYPDRVTALVLFGTGARIWPAEGYLEGTSASAAEELLHLIETAWGRGETLRVFAPTIAGIDELRERMGKFERAAASPGAARDHILWCREIDVRAALPAISVPTLVIHNTDDRAVPVEAGRWLAAHIPGARLLERPGQDHFLFLGDATGLLDEIQEFLTGSRGEAEIDRILATVLFTDIVGSTERAAELGDRRWKEVLERHDAVARQQIDRFRGRLIKSTGDGLLATFDGPARAVRAAFATRDGLRGMGVDIRAGLHAGEVELRGDDVGGIAVHIASRVQSKADPGEVLVSGTVKDLVAGSGITFEDHGAHTLKGIPDEWRLYAVRGA